ncbi:uncharacterized protein NPIL_650141 [Nephila pilipes]|uniref:Uncharacterized protein n=1 Tax=Nephila pilipes TaxID=299642 RepID=A0A8X6P084_NEPPI|nr:uncharacterized protein NPIL_650141 [Nephila pilipes]
MITETTVITNEEALIVILRKQLGKLCIVLELSGISILEEIHIKGWKYILYTIRKLFFPLFLHFSLFFLWSGTIQARENNYAAIIDMVVPLIVNVMWWMLYIRKMSLKVFSIHVANTLSTNLVSQTRYLAFAVNAALCLIFVFPGLLIKVKLFQNYENTVNKFECFRYVHEIIFPSIISVMYTAICYLMLENLRICKRKFQEELDLSSLITLTKLKKSYMDVVKGIAMFEDLFSAPVLLLVIKNLCTVSIVVMDMMYIDNWISKLSLESLFYLGFIFGSLGILTLCAGNIPLELMRIKTVLLDKMSKQSTQDGLLCGEKQVQYIIQRDITILTGWNVFHFDRGFLLKAFITVIAHAVLIFQLGVSVSPSQKSCPKPSTFS